MTNQKRNANLVDALGSALRSGDHGLKSVPGLLVRILSEESWRSFVTQRGELVEPGDFAQFVVTPPLKGLGASVGLLDKILDSVEDEAERTSARDLLDRALQRQHGGDRHSERFKLDNIQLESSGVSAPTGTSREAALRRLRKDAPELHAEVLAGSLSAHAAMVKAGFRHRTVSVPVDQPESAARALRKNLSPEDLASLRRLLDEPED